MRNDRISIEDRWRDGTASRKKGKLVLIHPSKRCPEDSRFRARVYNAAKAPSKPGGKVGGYESVGNYRTESEALAEAQMKLPEVLGLRATLKPTMSAIGEEYIQALLLRGGKDGVEASPRYVKDLRSMLKSLKAHGAEDITSVVFVPRVKAWIQSRKWSASTKHNRVSLLKKILDYGVTIHRVAPRNPLDVIQTTEPPKPPPSVYTIADLQKLVTGDDCPWHRVACLMVYTGYRLQMSVHLRWEYVDFEARCWRIPPSAIGNKTRAHIRSLIQEELMTLLLEWKQDEGPIVELDKLKKNLSDGWTKYVQSLSITPTRQPAHGIRYSHAGILTAANVSLFGVMQAVGHQSPTVAWRYASAAQEYRDQIASWPRNPLWPHFYLRRAVPQTNMAPTTEEPPCPVPSPSATCAG